MKSSDRRVPRDPNKSYMLPFRRYHYLMQEDFLRFNKMIILRKCLVSEPIWTITSLGELYSVGLPMLREQAKNPSIFNPNCHIQTR